jgi:hypothetical protein
MVGRYPAALAGNASILSYTRPRRLIAVKMAPM